jgi:hypothetical protein
MTIVVESSADQVEAITTGQVIQPADVIADNAAKNGKPVEEKPVEKAAEVVAEAKDDDAEDDNGLTASERKELTEKMQRAVGKKHRALKEAEEFAADQYNQRRLAEQRADQQDREIKRLQAQMNGGKPATETTADDSKPKREAFETDEAYSEAVIDWRVDQRLKAQESEQQKKAQEDRQREVIATAQTRIESAMELVPDYRETLEAADQNVPPHIAAYMQRSPMIAELGYYFAKNPKELGRLAELPPDEALVDIGEIKSKLQPFAKPKADAKATPSPGNDGAKPSTETGSTPSKPRAAAPIKPLGSGSSLQIEKDETDMNIREVINDWSKKKAPALRQRARH